MNKTEENYIDHEVRIRVQEGIYKEVRDTLVRLDGKIDSHFYWTLSTLFLLIVTVISLFGGSILLQIYST